MRIAIVLALSTALMAGSAIAGSTPAEPAAKPAAEKPAMPKLASTTLVDSFTGNYVIEQSHASLGFGISHIGYSSYKGRFNTFEAQLYFDAKDISKSSVKATVALASVDTHNSTLEAKLADKDWFNTAAFPSATFTSTKIEKTGAATGKITGDLSFLGVTKPVVLDVVFNGGGFDTFMKKDKLGFSAKGSFNRSDFGMNAYIPTVGDAVTIEIEAEFVKKD